MNKLRKIGFVSIEVVITAAVILSVGFAGLLSLDSQGREAIQKNLDKLDALNIFGGSGGSETPVVIDFDENGYAETLNIQLADVNPVADFTYAYDNVLGGWTITGYNNSSDKDVIIPKFHTDGNPIVKIGNYAFYFSGINSVAIPNSVKVIGGWGFSTSHLTSVIIPDSVVRIEQGAFLDNQLASVSLPASVTFIGEFAFNVNMLPKEKAFFYAGNTNKDEVISYGGFPGQSVSVPAGTKTIGNATFSSTNLQSLSIPASVTSIGNFVFNRATIATPLIIPNTVLSIGDHVFFRMSAPALTLSEALTTIPNAAFQESTLTAIELPASITSIGTEAFRDTLITSIILPEGLTSIGAQAFRDSSLTAIRIPSSVTTLDLQSLYTSHMTSATFDGNVPTNIAYPIFSADGFTAGSITVPGAQLAAYQAIAGSHFGLQPTVFTN